ncbi:S8 family serine peptidase [Shewanella nanhaiensis]|uniref:S8 family serine peptidase n=1 Tax=Shewanella nanhaiensis TaxID=2864872 RepID=A0ABS7E3P5_9GAMM|nr:S8 family serine peptidase [Shewanella nanhaiensis]MBW8184262.1 S8 family serine peptidase [Shewanella nanhaiensis]
MKTKLAVAISMALLTASIEAQTLETANGETVELNIPSSMVKQQLRNKLDGIQGVKFVPEPGLGEQEYVYIIRLKDPAVANYQGDIAGLKATSPQFLKHSSGSNKLRSGKLNIAKSEVKAYQSYLQSKQSHFLMKAQAVTGNSIEAITQFSYAFNGMSVRMTQAQAIKLAELQDVAFIERERMEQLETDVSQALIGSPQVWDGSATGTKAMGEGVIVGIIDSGINSDHDSFADIGQDGYDHTNPWGQGVYVGDCKTDFTDMCNDKLIGIRSYSDITDDYDDVSVFGDNPPAKNGEDYGGHGSHVASTAAGNILLNVPLVEGEVGKLESDGIETGVEFAQISGVAPHANIVSYQICSPGDSGDTYSGCSSTAILKAIDDTVKDGVDIINFSISGGGNPWQSSAEQAFLSARNAGIFVAVAAGNTRAGGPEQVPYSTNKNAPWYTSVANSTHNRDIARSIEFNNNSYDFTPGSGPVQTEVISAEPLYAGSLDATNIEGCNAFAAKAFENKVALIKRGSCNFSDKVNNAIAADAKAIIVFNKDGEANARLTMSSLEKTTIPAVFIGNLDGLEMVAALTENPKLKVTIDPKPKILEREADVLSPGSLIGPNATNDVIVPFVAAPGSDIYAAYSDQQFGHDKTGTNPADFTVMSGTSMASPHVAGAGALLKSAHKDWTPDNIRSALMLTATTAQGMKKADGKTIADAFDVGSGRIRVDLAAKTGLIMDELALNYEIANPATNGDPRKLNIPSMADSKCVNTCSWTRVVTATGDGNWSAQSTSITENLNLTVSPATFSLKAGESQSITVTADVTNATQEWGFGQLTLTSESYPDANMPIVAKIAKRNLPTLLTIDATRDADERNYTQLKAIDLPDLTASVTHLKLSDSFESKVKQDSNVSSALDDLKDGVQVFKFSVNDNALYFRSSISYTTSPDLDMFVLLDKKDGSDVSIIASSAFAGSNESVLLTAPQAGDYYVVVQNYQASAVGAEDAFGLKQLTLYDEASDNLSLKLTGDMKDFALNIAWDEQMLAGDEGLAVVKLKSSDDKVADVTLPIVFERKGDDVIMPLEETLSGNLTAGEPTKVLNKIEANKTQETRIYMLEAKIPDSHEVANISHDGKLVDNVINWRVEMTSGMASQDVTFDLIPRKASTKNSLTLSNTVDNPTAKKLEQTYSFDVAELKPTAKVDAPNSILEGTTLVLDASVSSDPNGDDLTYKWTQLGGTSVTFNNTADKISFLAPTVDVNAQTLSFQVEVNDGNGNSDSTLVSVSVTDKVERKSGGSLGWLTLLLLPLAWRRRKQG